jgi:predicted DNA-binding transcriptional regulator AlpA
MKRRGLQSVDAGAERAHQPQQLDEQQRRLVMRASGLLKALGMGRQRFYRKVRAGAFRHLEAPGPSAVLGYVVYSRTRVAAWIDSQAPVIRIAKRS